MAPFWGTLWPSRWLKPLLEFLVEWPGAVQEELFSTIEPAKRPASRRPRRSKRPPGSHSGGILMASGALVDSFWTLPGSFCNSFVCPPDLPNRSARPTKLTLRVSPQQGKRKQQRSKSMPNAYASQPRQTTGAPQLRICDSSLEHR